MSTRLAATHPARRIGELAHAEPELLIRAGGGPDDVFGAVWPHPPVHTRVTGLQQHAIVLHLSGCTLVEKWREGRLVGHHSRIGSITLVPAEAESTWVLGGHSRVAHLYVDPQRLVHAAASADGAPCLPLLRDFFAEDDEVSAALVRTVLAQARGGTLDALAHDQVLSLLSRHLLRRHAADRPLPPARAAVTLTAAKLRRLFEHIEQRLGGELRLGELAALARLSDDHFLRAFKAAVGQTPHQYVLARRIALTQSLLQHGALPIAAVAQAAGFHGASHFAAAFRQRVGTTPSAWRAQRLH
jgi:AraC family transcriptional regulator